MLYSGEQYGWRVLWLMHDRRTINRSQKILDVDFREILPEQGPRAEKSLAWRALNNMKDFWKAVRGEKKGIRSSEIAKS